MEEHETQAARALLVLNQEAFEASAELQMAAMEMSSRWTAEITDFMERQAQISSGNIMRMSRASTAEELANAQLDLLHHLVAGYLDGPARLLEVTEQVTRETGAGMRSVLRPPRQPAGDPGPHWGLWKVASYEAVDHGGTSA